MPAELSAVVTLQEGMHFVGSVPSGPQIDLDSPGAEGAGAGPSPMELVLISLAGCSGMDVISILRKKRQPVEGLEVRVRGARSDEYPTVYTAIELEYLVRGADVDPGAVARAIDLSRDRYCPVWAMLGQGASISASFEIVGAAG
ncbi:MAG: OsmC family protein [Kouleothrix sp.]|nr:OsmC family protein [Kouleothrix sp.]